MTETIGRAAARLARILVAMAPACVLALNADAVPAKPGPMHFDNGGKTLEVYLHGDETSHYYTSSDGVMLLRGDDGIFRYALPDGSALRASTITASDPSRRTADELDLLASFDRKAPFSILQSKNAQKARRRAVPKIADESYLNTFPTKGSPRCMAVLVEFQDVKFTLPDPKSLFSDMLNKEGFSEYNATGSARDYFIASSGGAFQPQFDLYGPVTLPYNMSYYGGNNTAGDDARPYEMVVHAVDLLSDSVDFSIYDTDDDGVVDNIYFFYAGYGEADGGPANSIWPHSWNIHDDLGMEIYMNGKLINHYATSNELANGIGSELAGIGVFCHEFSHVLGLPDLYSTTYTGTFTPDAYSLMDHGSYNNNSHTPPYHTGYERYCLGWIEPRELTDPANVSMYPVSQTGAYDDVYMIRTDSPSEYYILENRQQRGWDEYIPGHGMLVWHIDFVPDIWNLNIVNIEKQYIDIVEADNIQSEDTRSGDTFPGTANVREFTDDTKPSMRSWSGAALYSPITDITEQNGVISFAFKGGKNIFDELRANPATDIRTAAFTANWSELAKATGYLLSVYRKTPSGIEYLPGYRKREVGNVTSFRVEELDPETTYFYTVSGTDGRFYSAESNEVEVTTLLPTLDYKTVTALSASDITDTSFTARWEAIEDAESYEVCLYSLRLGEPFIAEAGFGDRTLPSGWTSDASFDGRSSYAVEVPSLRMTADGSSVSTGNYSGIRSISFWYRAASTGDDSAIIVSVFADGEWKTIREVSPLATVQGGATVTIDSDIPSTSTRVRLAFRRGTSGSVSIDDIRIGYGGNLAYTPIEGKEAIDAGNSTSLEVTGLERDADYGYSVTAISGDLRSKSSPIIGVSTHASGIDETVAADSRLRICGRAITVEGGAGSVEIHSAAGYRLASGRAPGFSFEAPAAGIYIVSIDGRGYKAVVK